MRQAGKGIGQRRPVPHCGRLGRTIPRSQLADGDHPGLGKAKHSNGCVALGSFRSTGRYRPCLPASLWSPWLTVTIFSTPIYQATARVEIDPSGEKFSLNGATGATDAEYLETQAQVLQGDTLAIEVIRKLRLDQNPAVMGKPDARKHRKIVRKAC